MKAAQEQKLNQIIAVNNSVPSSHTETLENSFGFVPTAQQTRGLISDNHKQSQSLSSSQWLTGKFYLSS